MIISDGFRIKDLKVELLFSEDKKIVSLKRENMQIKLKFDELEEIVDKIREKIKCSSCKKEII
ncbi:hypothetical protein J7L13_01260 [bacterium]|nr:hypothetical protein [bacterium]